LANTDDKREQELCEQNKTWPLNCSKGINSVTQIWSRETEKHEHYLILSVSINLLLTILKQTKIFWYVVSGWIILILYKWMWKMKTNSIKSGEIIIAYNDFQKRKKQCKLWSCLWVWGSWWLTTILCFVVSGPKSCQVYHVLWDIEMLIC